MCTVCGCSGLAETAAPHSHRHDHPVVAVDASSAGHDATQRESRLIDVEARLLADNDAHARDNRSWLQAHEVLALNVLSSPGSGKTTLLVRTIADLGGDVALSVIEGDQQTSNDADAIRAAGARAIQINTGKGCHLDAHRVGHAIETLHPEIGSVLFIENVGNLVCPAAFDLGERHKVVILSVTEGEDKPLKYPDMFAAADLMLVNKIDLLPHVSFDVDACIANARRVNPDIEVLQVSATTGAGLDAWLAWLDAARSRGESGH